MTISEIRQIIHRLREENTTLHMLINFDEININGKESQIISHMNEFIGLDADRFLKIEDYFDILDSYIDTQNPSMTGLGFHKKYKLLPEKTTLDKVIKNTYLVEKIIRNAAVHHQQIAKEKGLISLDYKDKQGNTFVLQIMQSAFELLNKLICNYIYLREFGYSAAYCGVLLTPMYNRAVDEILKIEAGDISRVDKVSYKNGCSRISFRRYICRKIPFEVQEKSLQILIDDSFIEDKENTPIDFELIYEKKLYVVPVEELNQNKRIAFENLQKFAKAEPKL